MSRSRLKYNYDNCIVTRRDSSGSEESEYKDASKPDTVPQQLYSNCNCDWASIKAKHVVSSEFRVDGPSEKLIDPKPKYTVNSEFRRPECRYCRCQRNENRPAMLDKGTQINIQVGTEFNNDYEQKTNQDECEPVVPVKHDANQIVPKTVENDALMTTSDDNAITSENTINNSLLKQNNVSLHLIPGSRNTCIDKAECSKNNSKSSKGNNGLQDRTAADSNITTNNENQKEMQRKSVPSTKTTKKASVVGKKKTEKIKQHKENVPTESDNENQFVLSNEPVNASQIVPKTVVNDDNAKTINGESDITTQNGINNSVHNNIPVDMITENSKIFSDKAGSSKNKRKSSKGNKVLKDKTDAYANITPNNKNQKEIQRKSVPKVPSRKTPKETSVVAKKKGVRGKQNKENVSMGILTPPTESEPENQFDLASLICNDDPVISSEDPTLFDPEKPVLKRLSLTNSKFVKGLGNIAAKYEKIYKTSQNKNRRNTVRKTESQPGVSKMSPEMDSFHFTGPREQSRKRKLHSQSFIDLKDMN